MTLTSVRHLKQTCFTDPLDVSIQFSLKLLLPPKFQKSLSILDSFSLLCELSRQDSQYQVEHEEGPKDDQRNKVDPVESRAEGIIGPVKHWSPSFHSNALKDSQHGEEDVVEGGDAKVWSNPFFNALRVVCVTRVGSCRNYMVSGILGFCLSESCSCNQSLESCHLRNYDVERITGRFLFSFSVS